VVAFQTPKRLLAELAQVGESLSCQRPPAPTPPDPSARFRHSMTATTP